MNAPQTRARTGFVGQIPRHLFTRQMRPTISSLIRVWGLIVLTWWVCGAMLTPWLVLPGVVLIGTMQYHLNVLGHDGLHYLLCDNRAHNDFLCRWLLHGPHGAPLGAMRTNHLNHHTNFGGARDLDRQYYDISRFTDPRQLWRWLAGALIGGMMLPIVRKLLSTQKGGPPPSAQHTRAQRRAADVASVLVSQAWISALVWYVTGWWFAYALLWLLPMFTVMMGLNSIRSMLEHASVRHLEPELMSFESSVPERFFLSPLNMNVHAEHHLVPAVPWHHLPALRRHLQENGHYGGISLSASYRARAHEIGHALSLSPAKTN